MSSNWQNSYFLILFTAAVIHGLYLTLLIGLRTDKTKSLVWLAIVLFSISALLLNYLLFISNAIKSFPHLLNLLIPFIYLAGPAFYFFVRKSENQSFKLKRTHFAHLIPLLFSVWESYRVAIQPVDVKQKIIDSIFTQTLPTVPEFILGNRFSIVTACYIIAALYFLRKRSQLNAEKKASKLKWLNIFSITFLCLIIGSLVIQILFIQLSLNGANLELTLTLIYALSLHILGYVVLQHQNAVPWTMATEKYATSPLDVNLQEAYRVRVISFLEDKKPWLNPEFSIGDLSRELSISRHHLSQVLNEKMGTSFNDLINAYRIQEVKNRLADDTLSRYSIFGIARDCGFASKSTFNRIFKKSTGITPSEYIPHVGARQL